MSKEKQAERPPQEKPEPWDSGEHMAADPSWPIEKRLKWHMTCGHILLLNCSEITRRKAAAAADREAEAVPEHGLAEQLREARRTADELRDELTELREQMTTWPTCPDGCGCRLGTEDADAHDCACDGPCCIACREMGYPDEPSYRDMPRKTEEQS